ncbi:MAG: C-terminal helicase domain-containing protein [Microthrixaceae bacterium]
MLPDEPAEIDLLIGTDCISEGQNLQDCDYLINYDIHWNPVRIIQRFGRVDRIGSPNTSIQLVNYWPDISLDEYINLKERVESRMMIADVTATGDDNVLSAQANDVSYRKEQLRRLQEEVIELEDLKTGVSITDLGLNDFRMDLLNYVKEHGELSNVPNGMHAVVPAKPDLGLHPGVIFTLRNRNTGVNVNQHNRLHPYYLVYIDRAGDVVHDHTEVKRLLDLARTCCKGQDKPIPDACQLFNEETAEGRQDAGVLRPAGQGHSLHDRGEGREGPGQPVHRRQDHGADQHHLRPGRLRTHHLPGDSGGRMSRLRSCRVHHYPKQAEFGRTLPKNKIYEHSGANTRLEGLVRRAGGADRLALQAGTGDDQPARQAGRAGDSSLRDPAEDGRTAP